MRSLLSVDHLHKSHTTFKMLAKEWVRLAILRARPSPRTICKDSFQAIKILTAYVQPFICDQSGQMLTDPLPHDSGFTMVNLEALFVKNGRHVDGKAFYDTLEFQVAGERQVVSVACVDCAGCFRQPCEPAIKPVRTDVGQSGRRRRALGQMPSRI